MPICAQIHITHCGTCRFKGVIEAQEVISISCGDLAYRAYPAGYPSEKAVQEAPFKGLKAVIMLHSR